MFARREVCVDGPWPAVGRGLIAGGEGGEVRIAFRSECGTGVDDVDCCGGGAGGRESEVDEGDEDIRNEIGVLKVAGIEIEERIDPDCGDGTVLEGEDCALFVVRGEGIDELRVPMFASPGSFTFRAEERRGFGIRQRHDDVEGTLRAQKLSWCRR